MQPTSTNSEKKQQSREELAPLFLAWLTGATVQYYSDLKNDWVDTHVAAYYNTYNRHPTLDNTFCMWVKAGYPIRLKPADE